MYRWKAECATFKLLRREMTGFSGNRYVVVVGQDDSTSGKMQQDTRCPSSFPTNSLQVLAPLPFIHPLTSSHPIMSTSVIHLSPASSSVVLVDYHPCVSSFHPSDPALFIHQIQHCPSIWSTIFHSSDPAMFIHLPDPWTSIYLSLLQIYRRKWGILCSAIRDWQLYSSFVSRGLNQFVNYTLGLIHEILRKWIGGLFLYILLSSLKLCYITCSNSKKSQNSRVHTYTS